MNAPISAMRRIGDAAHLKSRAQIAFAAYDAALAQGDVEAAEAARRRFLKLTSDLAPILKRLRAKGSVQS